MSNISNRHNINAFVAGKSQPLTGQRLAKVGWKTTKKQKAKFANICASVPMIDPAILDLPRWSSHIKALMETAQDGIIRSLYESNNGNLSSVSDDELSESACLAFLDAESNGGRLTKEFLASWFDEMLADNLTVALADRKAKELDDPMIQKAVQAYKGMITALSAGPTMYSPEQVAQLQKAIALASEDDETSTRLNKRLDSMLQKEKMEDLLGLD